jgi:hypothetical protein
MTERDKDQPGLRDEASASEIAASLPITPAEVRVIEAFFASKPQATWPASDLQRRMQASGG